MLVSIIFALRQGSVSPQKGIGNMTNYSIDKAFRPLLPTGIAETECISCFNDNSPQVPVEWKTDRPNKDGDYIVIFKNKKTGKVNVQIDWYLKKLGFGFEEYGFDDLVAWADIPPVS